MASSARNPQPPVGDTVLRTLDDVEHGSCDLAHDLGTGTTYNQDAFRYFLANERKRSELSSRPFLLLLVDLQQPLANGRIESAVASKLFTGLAACLRDTDLIGWYHEGRVAGAVLTHVDNASSTNVSSEIRGRVTRLLCSTLPAPVGARLQVRVYQLPAVPPQ
jgi:hypothetical protein